MMLDEREALSLVYDAATDVLTIRFAHDDARVAGARDATLLLDAAGYLVGLDLGDARGIRPIVMLGPHEKVERPVDAKVAVVAAGSAYAVRIEHAARAVRANEKNPYA
jgi:hypothetical protein